MKSKYSFLLFLTLIFIGCRKDAELSQTQRQTNAVQPILSTMADSLRTKGLTGWIPFLLKSPDFTWEFHGSRLTYDSLTSQIRREAVLYRSINLTWDSIEVKYQSFSEQPFLQSTQRQSSIQMEGHLFFQDTLQAD